MESNSLPPNAAYPPAQAPPAGHHFAPGQQFAYAPDGGAYRVEMMPAGSYETHSNAQPYYYTSYVTETPSDPRLRGRTAARLLQQRLRPAAAPSSSAGYAMHAGGYANYPPPGMPAYDQRSQLPPQRAFHDPNAPNGAAGRNLPPPHPGSSAAARPAARPPAAQLDDHAGGGRGQEADEEALLRLHAQRHLAADRRAAQARGAQEAVPVPRVQQVRELAAEPHAASDLLQGPQGEEERRVERQRIAAEILRVHQLAAQAAEAGAAAESRAPIRAARPPHATHVPRVRSGGRPARTARLPPAARPSVRAAIRAPAHRPATSRQSDDVRVSAAQSSPRNEQRPPLGAADRQLPAVGALVRPRAAFRTPTTDGVRRGSVRVRELDARRSVHQRVHRRDGQQPARVHRQSGRPVELGPVLRGEWGGKFGRPTHLLRRPPAGAHAHSRGRPPARRTPEDAEKPPSSSTAKGEAPASDEAKPKRKKGERKNSQPTPYRCEACQRYMCSSRSLRRHRSTCKQYLQTAQLTTEDKLLIAKQEENKCEMCGKILQSPSNLRRHRAACKQKSEEETRIAAGSPTSRDSADSATADSDSNSQKRLQPPPEAQTTPSAPIHPPSAPPAHAMPPPSLNSSGPLSAPPTAVLYLKQEETFAGPSVYVDSRLTVGEHLRQHIGPNQQAAKRGPPKRPLILGRKASLQNPEHEAATNVPPATCPPAAFHNPLASPPPDFHAHSAPPVVEPPHFANGSEEAEDGDQKPAEGGRRRERDRRPGGREDPPTERRTARRPAQAIQRVRPARGDAARQDAPRGEAEAACDHHDPAAPTRLASGRAAPTTPTAHFGGDRRPAATAAPTAASSDATRPAGGRCRSAGDHRSLRLHGVPKILRVPQEPPRPSNERPRADRRGRGRRGAAAASKSPPGRGDHDGRLRAGEPAHSKGAGERHADPADRRQEQHEGQRGSGQKELCSELRPAVRRGEAGAAALRPPANDAAAAPLGASDASAASHHYHMDPQTSVDPSLPHYESLQPMRMEFGGPQYSNGGPPHSASHFGMSNDLDYWDQIRPTIDKSFDSTASAGNEEIDRIVADLKRSAEANQISPHAVEPDSTTDDGPPISTTTTAAEST
ncbi:hypothetical protein M3Y99_00190400 [Aphelenchoides fujianensis]|nr:hypothetical protein M3Y99_00190400 [Aphelenchoides fujianensis]